MAGDQQLVPKMTKKQFKKVDLETKIPFGSFKRSGMCNPCIQVSDLILLELIIQATLLCAVKDQVLLGPVGYWMYLTLCFPWLWRVHWFQEGRPSETLSTVKRVFPLWVKTSPNPQKLTKLHHMFGGQPASFGFNYF